MKADVVVIGSGISGLTAAALLAKKNKKVVVVESHKNPGGALKRFTRRGIPFDIGFHYTGCLGSGDVLSCLWEYLGVLPKIKITPFPTDGCDLLKIRDSANTVHSYFSYERFEDELSSKFPDETGGIRNYIQTIKTLCNNIPFYNLEQPLTPFLRSFFDQGQNLAEFLRKITSNTSLQTVLASPAFFYGVPPANAGLVVHASVSNGFCSGAYAIKGGGQAIVDAYLDVLKEYDVTVLTSSDVKLIKAVNGSIKGIETFDKDIEARTVFYTGHPSSLLKLLPENNFRPAYKHRLQDLKNTGSMFVVFGTTNNIELAKKLHWRNYYSLNSGLNFLDVDQNNSGKNSLLMTSPSLRDHDTALPEKPFPVILMRPAEWEETLIFTNSNNKKRSKGYLEWKKQNCEQLIASAAEEFFFSPKDISVITSGSPLTFHDELKAPRGSVYGPQFCLGQYNPTARTKLNGLYLAGQGALTPGIVSAALSGLIAAGETEGIESLWEEVRKYR
jgi:all-trans-retinol 13,14-reductase